MTRSRLLFVLLLATSLFACLPHALEAQAAPLRPVTVGSPMPDFTLPAMTAHSVPGRSRRPALPHPRVPSAEVPKGRVRVDQDTATRVQSESEG